jgi:hypothetical protein
MKIRKMEIENFRAIGARICLDVPDFLVFVGPNDVGKSCILYALRAFFQKKCSSEDACLRNPGNPRIIVSFEGFPTEMVLDQTHPTSLVTERLVDGEGRLTVIREFKREMKTPKCLTHLRVVDYDDDNFANLMPLIEKDLIERCGNFQIEVKRAGGKYSNAEKRAALRALADTRGILTSVREFLVDESSDWWKKVESLFPSFEIFLADHSIEEGDTGVQGFFKRIVEDTISKAENERGRIENIVKSSLGSELDDIFSRLRQQAQFVEGIRPAIEFNWKGLVKVTFGTKEDDVEREIPLAMRGSGFRRLVMLSYFQHEAEKRRTADSPVVYAIEEPETFLHPQAQEDLLESLSGLSNAGRCQVMLTTHSPVFAGRCPRANLVLVTRSISRVAAVHQNKESMYEAIALELGVDPSHMIKGMRACILVEGPSDIDFLTILCERYYDRRKVDSRFLDKQIVLIPCGGVDSLLHWTRRRIMGQFGVPVGVFVDSGKSVEKPNGDQLVAERLQEMKKNDRALTFWTRKREIENYLHPDAFARYSGGHRLPEYSELDDVKKLVADHPNIHIGKDAIVRTILPHMTDEEIDVMSQYEDEGSKHDELLDIVAKFLALTDRPA